jgi:hypothetical protein
LIGAWRSLVAHLHGVQGVAGSNPAVPTNFNRLFSFLITYRILVYQNENLMRFSFAFHHSLVNRFTKNRHFFLPSIPGVGVWILNSSVVGLDFSLFSD